MHRQINRHVVLKHGLDDVGMAILCGDVESGRTLSHAACVDMRARLEQGADALGAGPLGLRCRAA